MHDIEKKIINDQGRHFFVGVFVHVKCSEIREIISYLLGERKQY